MPTIHLVRHAQGLHNLSTEAELLRDPELTDLGKEQCADLARRFPVYDGVTHIVASPMRRTLYTALLAFDRVLQSSSSRVTALPLIQEISTQPCDVGSPRSRLEEEFGEKVDFSLISENWYAKGPGSPYAPEMGKLEARARAARVWLRDFVRRGGEDTHVVVVGHGGFLHFLTGDWEGVRPSRGEYSNLYDAGRSPLVLISLWKSLADNNNRYSLGQHRVQVVRVCGSLWPGRERQSQGDSRELVWAAGRRC